MKTLGFGIVGAGRIAPIHADAIINTPGAKLVAVASRSPEKASKLASQYGIVAYTDYREMLKNPDIDCVAICTPSGEHASIGIDAARAGKHVIVEKPLDITLTRAKKLISECKAQNVKLAGIFQMRYNESSVKAKNIMDEGKLGKLILGDAYMKFYRPPEYYRDGVWKGTLSMDGGAALINQGIHGVDLLQWLMGPVDSVYAITKTLRHNIEGEDTVVAVLNFKNGASGVIESTTSVFPDHQQEIHIHGMNGTMVLAGTEVTYIKKLVLADGSINIVNNPQEEEDELGEPHRLQYVDFVEAINENREPAINGEESLKALEIVRAIYKSSALNQPVKLPLDE